MAALMLPLRFAAFCLLLCLPGRALGQQVVEVSTPNELQQALIEESKNIRIVEHIHATDVTPMVRGVNSTNTTNPGIEDLMFWITPSTTSITGNCMTAPDPSLKLAIDWKPGVCVVHVPGSSAFYSEEHSGVLWMSSLHILLTGAQAQNSILSGVMAVSDDATASFYLTDLTVESRPVERSGNEHILLLYVWTPAGSNGVPGTVELLASGVNVVHNPVLEGDVHYSTTGASRMAYFESYTGSVSLVDCHFNVSGLDMAPVMFSSDLRLENTSFVSEPGVPDLVFLGLAGDKKVYSDSKDYYIVKLSSGTADLEYFTLAESGTEERLAARLLPFLTLEDEQYLAVKSEVVGELPSPAPSATSPIPVSESEGAVGIDSSSPSPSSPEASESPSAAAIAGSVVGVVCFVGLIVAAVAYFVRRRRGEGGKAQQFSSFKDADVDPKLQAVSSMEETTDIPVNLLNVDQPRSDRDMHFVAMTSLPDKPAQAPEISDDPNYQVYTESIADAADPGRGSVPKESSDAGGSGADNGTATAPPWASSPK